MWKTGRPSLKTPGGLRRAYECLISNAKEYNALEQAYELLERLPPAEREENLERIFDQEAQWVTDSSNQLGELQVYYVPPTARERAEEAGYGEEFVASYVRQANGEITLGRLIGVLGQLSGRGASEAIDSTAAALSE